METVKVNTTQHIDIDYPVAGIGERTAAKLIDYGIAILFYILLLIVMSALDIRSRSKIGFIIWIAATAIVFFFYDLLCEIFMNGQSFGKKILKIKVISLNGAQPSLGQYFIRWIFRLVDFSPLTAYIGGLIVASVSQNKQRIGDIVAGTTLIKTVPRTKFENIAFRTFSAEYVPVFDNVSLLSDRDIELINEVLTVYYKTRKPDLIYQMADKVKDLLNVSIPEGVNRMDFLRTVVMDYNHITSQS